LKARAVLALCAALWCGSGAAQLTPKVDQTLLLAEAPAPTLAPYHLFVDAGAREPNTGLVPYALNTPLFSDYARKYRFVYVPGGSVPYADQGILAFPVGSVLIKTFAYPADFRDPDKQVRYIETRLLIHKKAGWVALTYVWNDAQTEATLKRAGARADVSFVDAGGATRHIDYAVPNSNQCKQCHSLSGVLVPIGPKARNLNGDFPYATGSENQLAHWSRIGLLSGAPNPDGAPHLPRADDVAAPLEARARAYLDVNCGHCHNPAGLASNSGLYLTYEESNPSALGINKRPVAAGKGSGNLSFSIAPGHPEQSILLYRMLSTEPGVMMPQIGRTVSDDDGVKLIRDYIASLK
jgi:uncharacterized repeat protein (TIGR03806 family)